MKALSEEPPIRRLLDVGRTLMTELDQRALLDRLLETARELTGARYAALGILNERRTELDQFLTVGIDEESHRGIGDLPRGRGVLGVLIAEPRPLRLANVGQHPRSYGFPAGHPVMRGFLGVPILIRGHAWGNLYLTDKEDGQFTAQDEEAVVVLSEWAAIAIENARLYDVSERRREELEKAFRGLESARDIAVAIGGDLGLEHVLELIAKRGRALIDAHSLVIMLRDGPELVVLSCVGHVQEMKGVRLPIDGSTSGAVLENRHAERITDVARRLQIAPEQFGVSDPNTALLVPMIYRGEGVGVLAAFDRGNDGSAFTEDDEQMLGTFAASAATAVALAQSVQTDRLRTSLAAADAERRRWARELHDETLQGLGGLRVLLSSALRSGDPQRMQSATREAVKHIEREIENLRTIITELRPAALDDLGLRTAIEALIERHRDRTGMQIDYQLALGAPEQDALHPELETTIYRLIQEALTNVVKHARATRVSVVAEQTQNEVRIDVHDDGVGFDPETGTDGFGLSGMRERVTLAGGVLVVGSDHDGTRVSAQLSTGRPALSGIMQMPERSTVDDSDPQQAAL
jgi:signal transduction histidine kinase